MIPFARAKAMRLPIAHPLTESERQELREWMAYMRDLQPKLERLMTACPTAKREIAALLRGD